MRKFICSILFSLLCSITFAQRIAVIEFNAGAGISQADVDGISAIFNTYFSPQGYTLVERVRIDRIIDEQQFQRGKLTEQQMVKIGQILNISQIVVGDVNIVMNQYNIDVRVLNVQTGTIAAKDGITWAKGSSYRTMMQQLATRLAGKIAIRSNASVPPSSSKVSKTVQTGVVVLYGYLKVYPEDLGQFDSYPQRIVEQINKNADYGYDTWRLPTKEEIQLIKANKEKIGGLTSANYMTDETEYLNGTIRLVTDGATKAVAYQAYRLCSTIDEYRNFIQQYPSGTYTEMAKQRIEAYEKENREAEYNAYSNCTTIDEYLVFVQQYPSGAYTEMAKSRIRILREQANKINGHEFVDLGLPSGTKWATCNVGANSPEEYGDYYEWGETKTNTSYSYVNCNTYNKALEDISGNPIYDVARLYWGRTWRIPTHKEFNELNRCCTMIKISQGGHYGLKVTGPNGNSIFLPYTGGRTSERIEGQGKSGVYWTSTPDGDARDAKAINIIVMDNCCMPTNHLRSSGFSIRPVSD